jgi:8-oxo-dGTP diphosphatase
MPKATVAAIVTAVENGTVKILLTCRSIDPFNGKWCLPGGHIDQYEPAGEAIIREVSEETGLDFKAQFFAYFDEIIPEYNIHAVVIVFTGNASGELITSENEVSDIKWFTIDEARAMPLAFTHNEILDTYVDSNVTPDWNENRVDRKN